MKERTEAQICAIITTCIAFIGITLVACLVVYDTAYFTGFKQGEFWGRKEAVRNVVRDQRIQVRGRRVIIEYDGETYEHYIDY